LEGSVFEADCMLAVAGNRVFVDGTWKPDAMYGPVDTSGGGGGDDDVKTRWRNEEEAEER
jgi:hypothetical protein